MTRWVPVLALVVLSNAFASCRTETDLLSETECESLIEHIRDVLPSNDRGDALDQCIRGETWNRPAYECAMKAYNRITLSGCLMKHR